MGPKADNKSYLFMTVLIIKCHVIFKSKCRVGKSIHSLYSHSLYSLYTLKVWILMSKEKKYFM